MQDKKDNRASADDVSDVASEDTASDTVEIQKVVGQDEGSKDTVPPVIKSHGNITLEVGTEFDPMAGVSAYDLIDGDIANEKIAVAGTVNTGKPGRYKLTYTVSDSSGNKGKFIRTITIVKTLPKISEEKMAEALSDTTYPTAAIDKIISDGNTKTFTTIVRFSEPVKMVYDPNDVEPLKEFKEIGPNDSQNRYFVGTDNDLLLNNRGNSIELMDSYPLNSAGNRDRSVLTTGFTRLELLYKGYSGSIEASQYYIKGGGFLFTDNGQIKIKLDRVSDLAGNSVDNDVIAGTVEISGAPADTTPPIITAPGDVTLQKGSAFNVREGVTATDNVDGNITANIVVGGTFTDTSNVGEYTVTYDVSDTAGNNAVQVIRNITVVDGSGDITPPKATIDTITTDGTTRTYSMTVRFDETVKMAYDPLDSVPLKEFFGLGPNKNQNRFFVNANNDLVVNSLGNSLEMMSAIPSDGSLTGGFTTLTIKLKGYTGTVEASEYYIKGGGFIFTESGKVRIKLDRVADLSGNSVDGTIVEGTVTLPGQQEDTTPPVITAPGDATLQKGSAFNVREGVSATDNVDGNITANVVVGGTFVDTSNIGTYTLTYDVSDAAGNEAPQVVRTITVVDGQADTTKPTATIDTIITNGATRTYTMTVRFDETVKMAYDPLDSIPFKEFFGLGPNKDQKRFIVGEDNGLFVNNLGNSLEMMTVTPTDGNITEGFKTLRISVKGYTGTVEASEYYIKGGGFIFTENGKVRLMIDRVADLAGNSVDGTIVEGTVTLQ